MADLDPATLEKFQKFQAMLAESPEIVEALNSPEILALAAKAAGKKNSTQLEPESEPSPELEPDYPVVGYGISDDVSVLSEMTTPTVMTKQSVEEDEYYPEVDGTGQSTSGLGGGPRRIGLKIGVSSFEDGNLPPPPPKTKIRSSLKMRHARQSRKTKKLAPMSQIVESDGSVSVSTANESIGDDSCGKPPLSAKKNNWKPKLSSTSVNEKLEPHPFFGSVGSGAIPRPTRHNSYNNKIRRTKGRGERGVNRNRSMPTNLKVSGSSSVSSDSMYEDDSKSKSPSEGDYTKVSNDSDSMPRPDQKLTTEPGLPPPPRRLNSKGKLSPPRPSGKQGLSPPRSSMKKSLVDRGPIGRGVNRNRSMPMRLNSSGSISSDSIYGADDDTRSSGEDDATRSTTEGEFLPKEKQSQHRVADSRNKIQSSGNRKFRGKSVPRMRLVPVVNKSIDSAVSSPAKLVSSRLDRPKTKGRSRSLSKYSTKNSDNNEDINSRASEPVKMPSVKKIGASLKKTKPRSRSLSKYSTRKFADNDDGNSHSSEAVRVTSKIEKDCDLATVEKKTQSDDGSESSNTKTERCDSSSSEESKGRPSVTRRWKPPSIDQFALPPAFRCSGSQKSSDNNFRLSGSSHSLKSIDSNKAKPLTTSLSKARLASTISKSSEEEKESRTEGQSDSSSSSDEEDYVRQTIRKPGKERNDKTSKTRPKSEEFTRPNPEQFKQYLSELTQVINTGENARPSDYLSGAGLPFAATRKKRVQTKKKAFGDIGESRSADWLGSGKVVKRTWKVKGTL